MRNDNYFDANRSGMVRFLPTEYSNVLEIGCASGAFSKNLSQAVEVWGVEPSPTAAARAAERMTRVLVGTFADVVEQLPDGYFDLVICNDVIEHMIDHDEFLVRIKGKMRSRAFLVGSLPNIRHLTALVKLLVLKDWIYADSGILDRTHLRFFTKKSIERTFRFHRFDIEQLEGIGSIIKHGLVRPAKPLSAIGSIAFRTCALIVVIATFGYYHDTQYPQYGFRLRATN